MDANVSFFFAFSAFFAFLMTLSLLAVGLPNRMTSFATPQRLHRATNVKADAETKSTRDIPMEEGTSTDTDSTFTSDDDSDSHADMTATANTGAHRDTGSDSDAAKPLKQLKPFAFDCGHTKVPAIDRSHGERMWASAFGSIFGKTVGAFDNYLPRDWEAAEAKEVLSYAFNHQQPHRDISAPRNFNFGLGLDLDLDLNRPTYDSFEIEIPKKSTRLVPMLSNGDSQIQSEPLFLDDMKEIFQLFVTATRLSLELAEASFGLWITYKLFLLGSWIAECLNAFATTAHDSSTTIGVSILLLTMACAILTDFVAKKTTHAKN